MMTASVVAVQMATSEENVVLLSPAEVKTLGKDGMTEGLMESLSSMSDVYINIAEPDAAIDALTNLIAEEEEEEPETKPYDMADLKNRFNYARTQQDKHMVLQEIMWDSQIGPNITQCDAFELFVHADPWRALKELTEDDLFRADLKLRGIHSAYNEPAQYSDDCFFSPFWQFEKSSTVGGHLLFQEGLLKPRVKQLMFHPGTGFTFPTAYNNFVTNSCPDICETGTITLTDDTFAATYDFSVKFFYN